MSEQSYALCTWYRPGVDCNDTQLSLQITTENMNQKVTVRCTGNGSLSDRCLVIPSTGHQNVTGRVSGSIYKGPELSHCNYSPQLISETRS